MPVDPKLANELAALSNAVFTDLNDRVVASEAAAGSPIIRPTYLVELDELSTACTAEATHRPR